MKKLAYIVLAVILGIILSFITHGIIEMIYLNWAEKNNILIKWTTVWGDKVCALPSWLIWLLPTIGAIFGLWLGFWGWKKVYGDKSHKG